MDTGIIHGFVGANLHLILNGHGFLLEKYVENYSKLTKGPLCPPLMAPW